MPTSPHFTNASLVPPKSLFTRPRALNTHTRISTSITSGGFTSKSRGIAPSSSNISTNNSTRPWLPVAVGCDKRRISSGGSAAKSAFHLSENHRSSKSIVLGLELVRLVEPRRERLLDVVLERAVRFLRALELDADVRVAEAAQIERPHVFPADDRRPHGDPAGIHLTGDEPLEVREVFLLDRRHRLDRDELRIFAHERAHFALFFSLQHVHFPQRLRRGALKFLQPPRRVEGLVVEELVVRLALGQRHDPDRELDLPALDSVRAVLDEPASTAAVNRNRDKRQRLHVILERAAVGARRDHPSDHKLRELPGAVVERGLVVELVARAAGALSRRELGLDLGALFRRFFFSETLVLRVARHRVAVVVRGELVRGCPERVRRGAVVAGVALFRERLQRVGLLRTAFGRALRTPRARFGAPHAGALGAVALARPLPRPRERRVLRLRRGGSRSHVPPPASLPRQRPRRLHLVRGYPKLDVVAGFPVRVPVRRVVVVAASLTLPPRAEHVGELLRNALSKRLPLFRSLRALRGRPVLLLPRARVVDRPREHPKVVVVHVAPARAGAVRLPLSGVAARGFGLGRRISTPARRRALRVLRAALRLRVVPYKRTSGWSSKASEVEIGVHHANAVVWEPVYRTHLRLRHPREQRVDVAVALPFRLGGPELLQAALLALVPALGRVARVVVVVLLLPEFQAVLAGADDSVKRHARVHAPAQPQHLTAVIRVAPRRARAVLRALRRERRPGEQRQRAGELYLDARVHHRQASKRVHAAAAEEQDLHLHGRGPEDVAELADDVDVLGRPRFRESRVGVDALRGDLFHGVVE
eukprot:31162-Pelagococcus_subviridis.AAC.2